MKAIPHDTDEGMWMSGLDGYGHGPGNGKSRNAVYKHLKKLDNVESIPVEETKPSTPSWMNEISEDEIKAKEFKDPLEQMLGSELSIKSQGYVIRTAYVGLDRLITHWGRGVMSKPEWEVERTPEQLDALETSTLALMEYYGVRIPVTPPMLWATTLGRAYVPPVSHVMKNRDPNRKRQGFFSRIFRRKKKIPEPVVDNQRDDILE